MRTVHVVRHIAVIGLAIALTTGCGSSKKAPPAQPGGPADAAATVAPAGALLPGTGTVLETMNGGGYTYVNVDIDGSKLWVAGPQVAVSVGDSVSLSAGMEMRDFHSKALERTFPVVQFVSSITPAGGRGASAATMPPGHSGGTPKPATAGVTAVERVEGGQTVAEVVGDAAAWSGKEIAVRGHVVKYMSAIMGKNWLHVQDGTGADGSNDLTVTTDATVAVGDIVVVRGVLTTNRDFGSGYRYAVIVEDAAITKE